MSDESDVKKSQMQFINELSELCAELGWVVSLPDNEKMISGLIIGTKPFVEEVSEQYYGPAYTIIETGASGDLVEGPPTKKIIIH